MTSAAYLRFPHVQQDLLTFVAEDDVWLAPAEGGRAWRLSADDAAAAWPRLSGDGSQVAWSGTRDKAAEVYLADVTGGPSRRLTYWGDQRTKVCGFDPAGEVLAVTPAGPAVRIRIAGPRGQRGPGRAGLPAAAVRPGIGHRDQ